MSAWATNDTRLIGLQVEVGGRGCVPRPPTCGLSGERDTLFARPTQSPLPPRVCEQLSVNSQAQ